MSTDNASRKRRAEGYEPRFDLDLEYGQQGELLVLDVIEDFKSRSVEVKRDARWSTTGNLYVEYECLRASGWCKSGIADCDALLWAFVLGDTETMLIVPAGLLRNLCRDLYKRGKFYRVETTTGSHPTRGVKVPLGELFSWLTRLERSA